MPTKSPATQSPQSGLAAFNNLKIAVRIGIGFGLLVTLLIVVFVMMRTGIVYSGESFDSYAEMADDTKLMQTTEAAARELRLALRVYLADRSKENVQRLEDAETALVALFEKAKEEIRAPERVALLNEAAARKDAALRSIDETVRAQQERDRLVYEVLDPVGSKIRDASAEFARKSLETGDLDRVVKGSAIEEAAMMARLRQYRFLDRNDPRDAEDVVKYIDEAMRLVNEISDIARTNGSAQFIADLTNALPQFKAAAVQVRETIEARNRARDAFAAEATESTKLIDQVIASVSRDAADTQRYTKNAIDSANRNGLLTAIVAIALGIAAAILIARSITKPVSALTTQMTDLAGGQTAFTVAGLGR
jgi:methyl-accepting chemotaxis protein